MVGIIQVDSSSKPAIKWKFHVKTWTFRIRVKNENQKNKFIHIAERKKLHLKLKWNVKIQLIFFSPSKCQCEEYHLANDYLVSELKTRKNKREIRALLCSLWCREFSRKFFPFFGFNLLYFSYVVSSNSIRIKVIERHFSYLKIAALNTSCFFFTSIETRSSVWFFPLSLLLFVFFSV